MNVHQWYFHPQTRETPPVVRQVGSGIYHAGRLEKARTAVIEDLGTWIPEIPIEFMLDHILPPVRCDYDAVKRKLKNSKRILKGQWAGFPTDPKSSKLHENKVFCPLEQVFADIAKHARDSVMRFSARDVSTRVIADVAVEDNGQAGGEMAGQRGGVARRVWVRRPARAMPQCSSSSITLIRSHIRPG